MPPSDLRSPSQLHALHLPGTIPRSRRLYLGVLEDRLGVQEEDIPGVSEQALLDAFRASLRRRSRELPCFGSGVMSSEEWWAEVVRAAFRGAGVEEESLEGVFDEVFYYLFHHVFTSQPAWELVPVGFCVGATVCGGRPVLTWVSFILRTRYDAMTARAQNTAFLFCPGVIYSPETCLGSWRK